MKKEICALSIFFPMIYENGLILYLFCIWTIQAECLEFSQETVHVHENFCRLAAQNSIRFRTCLQCFINGPTVSFQHVNITKRCSPLSGLRCVELRFQSTETFLAFINLHSNTVNRLFDQRAKPATAVHNALWIYIAYDSLDEITRSTIEPLERIVDRSFQDLRLTMGNRGNRTTLAIDPDLQSVTFRVLKLSIYCSDTVGWNSIDYIPRNSRTTATDFIHCQLSTQPMFSTTGQSWQVPSTRRSSANRERTTQHPSFTAERSSRGKFRSKSTSAKPFSSSDTASYLLTSKVGNSSFHVTRPTLRKRSKWILSISLAACGCLLVCLLLACYLSIFCGRDEDAATKRRRFSSPWSLTDTSSNMGDLVSNRWRISSFWMCHRSVCILSSATRARA